jgi:predicted aldo/keto reductase-like oxidoreductase
MEKYRISRRQFVKESSLAAAGLAVASGLPLAFGQEKKPEERNKKPGMRYRVLGRTNLLVSELSLGGVGIQAPILEAAIEKGVNLVHLADAYKGCLPEAAKVVKDKTKRGKLFIAMKPVGSPEQMDTWLKTLETDHVDIIMHVGSVPDAKEKAQQIREKFEALKKAGKARFLGITCHSNVEDATRAAVESGVWDVINPQYGAQFREKLDPILAEAKKKNIGVVGMKALAGAAAKPEAALQTALANKNMDSVWKGIPSVQMLDALVRAVNEPLKASEREEFWRHVAAQRAHTCAMCSACLGCPRGIAVEEILRCSLYYEGELGESDYARAVYHELSPAQTPANCADCGRCEKVCPNRLPVRRLLREAQTMLA